MLVLQVLGSLSLTRDDGEVPAEAQQKRRLGLLSVLCIAGERGIPRERLQSFFWPESDAARARHALDQLLYSIRRSLGIDPFIAGAHDLRLNSAVVQSDLAEFEKAIDGADWQTAVAVYRGPLLDGVFMSDSSELEQWLDLERQRVTTAYQRALEMLADEAAGSGDVLSALRWWRQLGASDPLSSRIALGTMKALEAAGDCVGAVQFGRAFQDRVRNELGVEPDNAVEKRISQLSPPIAQPKTTSKEEAARRRAKKPATATAFNSEDQSEMPAPAGKPGWRRWAVMATTLAIILTVATLASNRPNSVARAASGRRARGTSEPAARLAYLRGANAWGDRSKEGLDTAVIYFRRASEIDPSYAEAYAGLANAYVLLGYSGYRPAEAMFPKAKAAALRSIDLDSTLAAPHAALAHELMWERDFARSEAEFRKSIELDAGYATAHQWYAMLLMMLGRTEEAVSESARAAQLDPLSLQIQNTYATFLNASGRHEAALLHYQKFAGDEPDSAWVRRNPWLLTNMAATFAANGRFARAIRTAERATKVVGNHPRAVSALASVYINLHELARAREIFARADTANEQYPAYRGIMYAKLGQPDSAFFWFDRVRNWPIPVMIQLRDDAQLAAVRRDPRFDELLRRLGLVAAQ